MQMINKSTNTTITTALLHSVSKQSNTYHNCRKLPDWKDYSKIKWYD